MERRMQFDPSGNQYFVEIPNLELNRGQLMKEKFEMDLEVSNSAQEQSGGQGADRKRSETLAMEADVIDINPTGIITYMSVQEARARGLIEETEIMDTETVAVADVSGEDGYYFGEDEASVFGHLPGNDEEVQSQCTTEADDDDNDSLMNFDPEEFVRNMFRNPFRADPKNSVTPAVASKPRTVIPIRKSSAASGKATPGGDADSPFVCDLCSEKFKKKLFLNNHMESRHGIKFVFTEKGKKVKLVRMPTEVKEGEKLDPCVRLLMDSNGNNSGNIIGVQPVETVGEMKTAQTRSNPTAHEVDPFDLLQGRANMNKDFGSAILIKPIRTWAMKKALDRGETPFAAFRPFRSKKLYLLSVTTLNKNEQLLMNATEMDLENSDGTDRIDPEELNENEAPDSVVADSIELEQGLTMTKVLRPGTKFSHVCVVVYVEQVREGRELVFKYSATPITEPVALMKPDYFARCMIQTKPKRLRCLSMPIQTPARTSEAPVTVTKRKYTRRSFGRRNSGFVQSETKKNLTPPPSDTEDETLRKKTKFVETPAEKSAAKKKMLKKKRKIEDNEEDEERPDDEETDLTYLPYRHGSGQGSGKRGRGRPRRLL